DPAVRIGPLELLDGAFQGHALLGIEHGEGMMCGSGDSRQGDGEAREAQSAEFHGGLLVLYRRRCTKNPVPVPALSDLCGAPESGVASVAAGSEPTLVLQ